MKKLYFYFGDRHYRVVDQMVLPFCDYFVDKVEIGISWIFNNKPRLFVNFTDKNNNWMVDSLAELLSDLKTIEAELIKIDYSREDIVNPLYKIKD